MFGSYESSLNYDSDINGCRDNNSLFPSVFLGNMKIMVTSDLSPIYTTEDQITSLQEQLIFSSSDDE